MKLKLRIKKDLKRDLKALAIKKEIERKEFVEQLLEEFVNENKEICMNDIEEFMIRITENAKKSEAEIIEINGNESLNADEKAHSIREIKGKYRVIRYISKMSKKKTETLMINLEEQIYYGLLLIAEGNKMSIEQFVIKILTEYVNINKI